MKLTDEQMLAALELVRLCEPLRLAGGADEPIDKEGAILLAMVALTGAADEDCLSPDTLRSILSQFADLARRV